MGIADEIRKKQAAEAAVEHAHANAAKAGYEQLCRNLDAVVPELSQAMQEFKIKPTVKLGFMKKAWTVHIGMTDLNDDHPNGCAIAVTPNGSWSWHHGSGWYSFQRAAERGRARVVSEAELRERFKARVEAAVKYPFGEN